MDRERFGRFRDHQVNAVLRVATANNAAILSALEGMPRLEVTESPVGSTSDKLRILIAFRPPPDEDINEYDWIHCAGAGMDHLLSVLPSDEADRPLITRTIGRMGEQMGAYCLSYILADLQRHADRARAQLAKNWDSPALAPRELFDETVGLVGTGAIGSGIAKVLKPLARSVYGLSKSGRPHFGFDDVWAWEHPGVFHQCSFVIGALPSTSSTRGLMGIDFLSQFRGAFFINVGRGATVEMADLREALDAGHIRHCVLDVFDQEPLPTDHWCWDHPQVTVTPHVAGITRAQDTAEAFRMHWEVLCNTG